MPMNSMKTRSISDYIYYVESILLNEDLFYGHGTSNARDEAAYLVLTITKDLPVLSSAIYDKAVSAEEKRQIDELVKRRVNEKVPAAYLLQEAWFAGMPFYVNENVLVPRSPFAELITDLFEPWVDSAETKTILDLCTGSGCIGIAAAVAFPKANVDISDLSEKALLVANENVKRHALMERVSVIQSDLYENLAKKQYDLIISNPPYVSTEEVDGLPAEYKNEPRLGLEGGESGLDLVHSILAFAADHLTDQGVIFIEVGSSAETLEACYPEVPFLWQDFEYGGDGVFMLTKVQLLEHRERFMTNIPQL